MNVCQGKMRACVHTASQWYDFILKLFIVRFLLHCLGHGMILFFFFFFLAKMYMKGYIVC